MPRMICFDLKGSKKIEPKRRSEFQNIIISESIRIRESFPQMFSWSDSLNLECKGILGYTYEPFIFGDMWCLTLSDEADIDFIIEYFKERVNHDFYCKVGSYKNDDDRRYFLKDMNENIRR